MNTDASELRRTADHSPHLRDFWEIVNQIKSQPLCLLCIELKAFPDFWTWPASLSFHHAYETGLIQHTLEVVSYALHMADRFPDCNRDVLIAAALWHDWGKIHEYEIQDWRSTGASERPRYLTRNDDSTGWNVWVGTDYAKKVGHIAGSANEFYRVATAAGVDPVTINAVCHCILAHHGPVREWGSPVPPQTLEALLLHQSDMLSAKHGSTK